MRDTTTGTKQKRKLDVHDNSLRCRHQVSLLPLQIRLFGLKRPHTDPYPPLTPVCAKTHMHASMHTNTHTQVHELTEQQTKWNIFKKMTTNNLLKSLGLILLSHLEVSQSGLGQRDVLHQQAAVFGGYVGWVKNMNLSGENDREVLQFLWGHLACGP